RRHALHLGAEHLEQRVFLRRLVVRHHDQAAVAAGVADVREPDAGVARRAFHHHAAGGELAALLGAVHDGARGAVLDRAAGVHELGLAEDLAAGVLAHTPQAQERRVADRADEAGDAAHATAPSAAAPSAAASLAASVARLSAVPSAATAPVMSSAGALARCS